MTVIDMQHMFLLKIKTLDRTDIKDPFSYDIVALLNNAQDILTDELIINKRYDLLRPVTESVTTSSGWDSYATGISADGEGSQVNLRVVKLTTLAITANTVFRSYVRSQSEITHTYAPTISVAINVQNEDIPKDIIGDFETTGNTGGGTNFPIFTRPKAILEGDYLIVLGDYYTNISKVFSVVVRSPKILHLTTNSTAYVTTCELPVELHNLIVDKAVQIFGETVNINDLKKKGN